IPDMIRRFDVPVGYSDHTLTAFQAALAVGLGAAVIEKHVIDAREPATADSSFSSLPDELKELIAACREAYAARGTVHYGPTDRAGRAVRSPRSLYAVADLARGEPLTQGNTRSTRPGHGPPPAQLPNVLGRPARRAIRRGEPLRWEHLA